MNRYKNSLILAAVFLVSALASDALADRSSGRLRQRGASSYRQKATSRAKQRTTGRYTIRNPGSLMWSYQGNSAGGKQSKDARRAKYGLDPFGTSQTKLEAELQASIDVGGYANAVKLIEKISKDPKAAEKLIGKKGWTIKAKPAKQGTLRMRDFYADDPSSFALTKVGGTARWRSVQRLDQNGKPVDDRQQLNVKAGFRRLRHGVLVRVEQGNEVAGLVKNGRIVDSRLRGFLTNHRLQDNPANLIRQLLPGTNVLKVLETPLVEVKQQRYKFHVFDQHGVNRGEGSIDIVEAKPTAQAKKIFGRQLKRSVKFGRVEYEGDHVSPTLTSRQRAMASGSSRPHGAFDVYSNSISRSKDIQALTKISGNLAKTLGAKPSQGNKVFEAMSRLGFFNHMPGGAQGVLKEQQRNQAKWMKQLKKHNPGLVD